MLNRIELIEKLQKFVQDKDISEFWIDDTRFKIENGILYYYAITFQWMKVDIKKLTSCQLEAILKSLERGCME